MNETKLTNFEIQQSARYAASRVSSRERFGACAPDLGFTSAEDGLKWFVENLSPGTTSPNKRQRNVFLTEFRKVRAMSYAHRLVLEMDDQMPIERVEQLAREICALMGWECKL